MINVNIEKPGEAIPEVITNVMRWFRISYSFIDNQNRDQEKQVHMVAYSLGDAIKEIQLSLGRRPVSILSHSSGRQIDWISKPVLRNLVKRNLNWYQEEKSRADTQVKIDKMKASQSAKIERANDQMHTQAEKNKIQAAKRIAAHKI